MTNKKIVIESCKDCPLMDRVILPIVVDGKTIYDTCRHPAIDGMDVSDAVIDETIHTYCPLEDDYHVNDGVE